MMRVVITGGTGLVGRALSANLAALMVVDKDGQVAYKHYGSSVSDILPNPQILSILDGLNQRVS